MEYEVKEELSMVYVENQSKKNKEKLSKENKRRGHSRR